MPSLRREIGRVYRPHLGIHATPRLSPPRSTISSPAARRAMSRRAPRLSGMVAAAALPQARPVNLSEIISGCGAICRPTPSSARRGHYPADSRFYRFRAAWAPRWRHYWLYDTRAGGGGDEKPLSWRTVLAINGDGDFLMNGQEFAPPCNTSCRSSRWCFDMPRSAPSACIRSGNIRPVAHRSGQIRTLPPWPKLWGFGRDGGEDGGLSRPLSLAAETIGLPSISM